MLTYQQETFTNCLQDLQQLWPQHFEEVATFPDFGLNVDLDRFYAAEKAGHLVIATVRDAGRLVGYMMDFVFSPIHYKHILSATSDAYYILPNYRAKCARKLLKLIEQLVKNKGAVARVTRAKLTNKSADFHALLGYEAFEISMKKEL